MAQREPPLSISKGGQRLLEMSPYPVEELRQRCCQEAEKFRGGGGQLKPVRWGKPTGCGSAQPGWLIFTIGAEMEEG